MTLQPIHINFLGEKGQTLYMFIAIKQKMLKI